MTSKSYKSQDYIETLVSGQCLPLHCFANAQMLEQDTRPAQEHRRLHRRVNAASVRLLPCVPQAGPLRPADKNKLKFSENGHTHMNKSRQAATYQYGDNEKQRLHEAK